MKMDLITNMAKTKDNPNDEFYTPEYAITPLLKYIQKGSKVWCPFDTEQSNYVKILSENCDVTYGHIFIGKDFFTESPPDGTDFIISNPPYSLKTEVFERLFKLKIPFAMLVGVVGLFESQRRFNLFANNKFEIMYFNKRVSFLKNYSDTKPALNPPFSSGYICSGVLPETIIFEQLNK